MAMPTTAAAIGSILAVTSEMTLTTNPMIDSTTATDQAQLFPSNRLYATTNNAIHRISILRGINNTPNTVKIDPLSCASAVCPPSKVKAPAITKRTPNIVTLVGLCLIRSLLLLLLLILVICMYILYNRSPVIYGFLQIVPQCSIACELYMIELNTLSTLTASITYFLSLKTGRRGFLLSYNR